MEYFYREMRRKTDLLMDGDQPEGGKWNYDHDNRKPAPDEITFEGPLRFDPDETVAAVLSLVAQRFGENFGDLHPFWFATDTAQAQAHLDHWLAHGLPKFGDFQDAMMQDHRFMYHAIIGLYLNGDAPLNAVEGFIRQIIGWREYIRGIYFLEGPAYTARNHLKHTRDLPAVFWGGERCL